MFTVRSSYPVGPYYNLRRPFVGQAPDRNVCPIGVTTCQHTEESRAKTNPPVRGQVGNRSQSCGTFLATPPAAGAAHQ